MINKLFQLFLATVTFASSGPTWNTNFNEAQKHTEGDKKVLLLYFSGSDWCRPCMLIKDNVFESEEFNNFADEQLVLVMFDFPAHDGNKLESEQEKHNEKMAELYNPKGNFPHIVILSATGKKLAEFPGYHNESAKEYISKLQKVIAGR